MKIYLAGHGLRNTPVRVRRRLHSYTHSTLADMQYDHGYGAEVALDSGAFSAWSKGTPVNLDEYIKFVHSNRHMFSWYANLDVIGNAKATWDNQKEMERQGLRPLPCFHMGEDYKYLYRYMNNYEYIALGGVVGASTRKIMLWLDGLFADRVTDSQGRPFCKFHGFGLSSPKVIRSFPWYSADSATWLMVTGYGDILVPPPDGKGGYRYDLSAWQVGTFVAWTPKAQAVFNYWAMKGIGRFDRRLRHIDSYVAHQGFDMGESLIIPTTGKLRLRRGYEYKINAKNGAALHFRGGNARPRSVPVERVVRRGLCNDLHQRRQFAANYFAELEDAYPWPRVYQSSVNERPVEFHYDHR